MQDMMFSILTLAIDCCLTAMAGWVVFHPIPVRTDLTDEERRFLEDTDIATILLAGVYVLVTIASAVASLLEHENGKGHAWIASILALSFWLYEYLFRRPLLRRLSPIPETPPSGNEQKDVEPE